jgi:hypothetical protein
MKSRMVVMALVACLLAGGVVTQAHAATAAAFTPEGSAAELMRLLAGERAFAGVPVLEVDPFLAWVARDGPVPCPAGGPVADGRAKDMALSGILSHSLRLCPAFDIGSALTTWGYGSRVGEIVAMNGGYDFSSFPYTVGCQISDPYQEHCLGTATSAPMTVAIAASQFMYSAGHRDVVLDPAFDRFACGAWQAPNGDDYYACLYASGPGTATMPPPTPSPIPTAPEPTPVTSPGPTPSPEPSTSPGPSPSAEPAASFPTIAPRRPVRRYGRERIAATVRAATGIRWVILTVDGRVRLRVDCRGRSVCAPAIWLRLHRGSHRVRWFAVDRGGRSKTMRVTVRVA